MAANKIVHEPGKYFVLPCMGNGVPLPWWDRMSVMPG